MPAPKYIVGKTGYDLCLSGPYQQRNVTMRAYAFQADRRALEDVCRRYLNEPLGADKLYKPLGGTVLLTMLNMARVTATPEQLGHMHEIDGAFQFPIYRSRLSGHVIDATVAAFMPYLWVNSDWPLVTGREALGFRKGLGTSFSEGDDDQATNAEQLTHIEGWVIPAQGSRLVKQRIVEIHHDRNGKRADVWTSLPEAARAIGAALLEGFDVGEVGSDAFELATSTLLGPPGVRLPIAFLKQHRDASDPALACHQRVFEADGFIPLNGFRGGGILSGDHTVTLYDHLSHPVRSELGLPGGPLRPRFAFELDFDFDMRLP